MRLMRFFALDREMPEVREEDLLAIMSAGAYGFTMASNYNSRPLPAEALVRGDKFALIRERQTYADLVRGDGGSDPIGLRMSSYLVVTSTTVSAGTTSIP